MSVTKYEIPIYCEHLDLGPLRLFLTWAGAGPGDTNLVSKERSIQLLELEPRRWLQSPASHGEKLFSNAGDVSGAFVSSSSEQPCSPLWAFSDGGLNGNHATNGGYDGEKISSASGVSSFRLADYPLFLPC